jgi:hypothetical protein
VQRRPLEGPMSSPAGPTMIAGPGERRTKVAASLGGTMLSSRSTMRTMLYGIGRGGADCEGESPHDLQYLYLRRRASQESKKQ